MMGLASRKPLLPAPTESLVDESAVDEPGPVEDASTDLSVRTDRTHHTIPEDGSPITIHTHHHTKSSHPDKTTKSAQNSQTSLLIEYFEGGKAAEPGRRPSVRVKVIPSRKSKDKGEGHIVLTEARAAGNKNQSTSRRISLGSRSPQVGIADSDLSTLDSLHTPVLRSSAPLDIEIQHGSDMSEISASPEARYIPAPSDISSMPADSMLGLPQSTLFQSPSKPVEGSNLSSLPPENSVVSEHDVLESPNLKPPFMPRDRNASNERITQKVIEKLSNKPREPVKTAYGRSDKSSSRSTSRDATAIPYERARTTGKNFRETDSSLASAMEPSILSNSVLSMGGKSDHSNRSNNSINNPKLLQTVEDAIRRLILPELKELKKDQRHQSTASKYDNSYSDLSETSIVKERPARRSTSGSKSRRRSSTHKDHGESSGSRRRRSSQRDVDYDSLSDSGSRRHASVSSVNDEDVVLKKRSGPGPRARDLAAAGIAGAGLTAAALHERGSEDSLQRRRRRKRSKSRSSRSGSIAESEEIFEKHRVPPMPMQSDLDSELTRSSLLSSNTATSHTPTQREIQHVVRGSPREGPSPASNTTPRMSGDLRHTLGTHHGNFSEHNLSANKLAYEEADDASLSPETEHYHSYSAEDILSDQERWRQYERNLHTQHPIRRGLSPIASVASYQTTEPNRHSMHQPRSQDSLASMKKRQQQLKEEVSISSFTSAPRSPESRRNRPSDISLRKDERNMASFEHGPERSPEFQSIGVHDRFTDDDHEHYRESIASDNHNLDGNRFSTMTDETSSDLQYLDKVTAGQHVVPVVGARPEFVPAPFGVESGVASLVEASVLSAPDSRSSHKSSFVQEKTSNRSLPRNELMGARVMSPPKDHFSIKSGSSLRERIHSPRADLSPPQSPAHSYEENAEDYITHERPQSSVHSPLPDERVEEKGSPESEITTNPSVIHGPILGIGANRGDHWVPDAATPPMPSQGGMSRDFSSGAIDLIPEGLNVSQRQTYDAKPSAKYVIGGSVPTPPGVKMDEGYQTGDNYPSPGPLMKHDTNLDHYELADEEYGTRSDDPFTTKRNQYMSGLSQGMSPLYDGATGKGKDRIQSKDIVALMDHLTVRDAQRNARDTEILVTLVRSAADMRNSFEEMKAFIAEQDELIMSTADKQHAQTQKVIGGPRPQPASTRGTRTPTQEDVPNKRRNVFKRALQGLGSKNTAELQNIESMLMQLLDEVEALRAQQGNQVNTSQPRNLSFASEDAARPATDTGYEPEGRAGTASTGADRSMVFSNNSSRQGQYSAARRVPENRVSVVMEGDEEYDDYGTARQMSDNQRTPRATSPSNDYAKRAQSEPLGTPPGFRGESQGALSNENTPMSYHSGDKNRKTFSSFLPKVVSRWSKTTASSGDDYRQSTQSRARPYSQVSRSGDAIHDYEYENNPDDRLRSATSLQDDRYYQEQENRPPSPLVPSAMSENPKYQVHRDSWNLEHPQPRPGSKYQFKLENAAQTYRHDDHMSPISQVSSNRWENQQQQAYNPRNLSPISDRGYSEAGSTNQRPGSSSSQNGRSQGPPRPSKIPLNEEPLVPQRTNKISIGGTMSPSTYVDNVRAARGSPAFDKSPVAALRSPQSGNVVRKPSGPRPISSQSNRDAQKKTRFTNSPVQSIDSDRY